MPSKVSNPWPEIDFSEDCETFEALHLWSQIVGKARTACAPWLNHGWPTALCQPRP